MQSSAADSQPQRHESTCPLQLHQSVEWFTHNCGRIAGSDIETRRWHFHTDRRRFLFWPQALFLFSFFFNSSNAEEETWRKHSCHSVATQAVNARKRRVVEPVGLAPQPESFTQVMPRLLSWQMGSCTPESTSISWGRTRPSTARWASRRPCAPISTTPDG